MLNVNWQKNSLNNFICHLSWLKELSPTHTHPLYPFVNFQYPTSYYILSCRVTYEMLNVNWEKIHSIILSLTCHGLRKLSPAHTHPLKTSHEFLKPYV